MDQRARQVLSKLLAAGDRAAAGVTTRAPASMSSHLAEYRQSPSLQSKESFELTMNDARARGAVELVWDDFTKDGFISRVNLVDAGRLAGFLGRETAAEQIAAASRQLERHVPHYPVLGSVIERWRQLKTARGLGPLDVKDWLDAIRVVEFARQTTEVNRIDIPLRVASARLFNDSKRIGKLAVAVDSLLIDALGAAARDTADIWRELGLFHEEQPVFLAGNVVVRRGRVTGLLDSPYAALPAATIKGLASDTSMVLSIENLTTFHAEARSRADSDVLLVYTAGTASPAWRAMYRRLLRDVGEATLVCHWGDLDEGGFRIAALISKEAAAEGHSLRPWLMSPDDVPPDRRRPASALTLARMSKFACDAGWSEIAAAVLQAGFTVEQEGLL